MWEDVLSLGLGKRVFSSAQNFGVHSINICVILGKCYGESAVAARAVGVLSDISRFSG